MNNRVGQTIDGRYKVEGKLGSGGMADVLACEDRQLGRRVALKVLHEQLAQDPTVVQRFRREASSAAGLQHPHVVSVFDRGDWNGIPYMAMELVDGVTLKDVINQRAPLDPVETIDQVCQILDALRYAHRRGLVHRDIKPQNVLVGPDGELKVADFGIARAVDDLQMTQTGMIVGTAHYLSPEQASGLPITPAADLYSVGVVLFEMLTGRMPFEGDQPVAIALKHVNDPPPALSVVNPQVPADLERVVLKALAKSPEERFTDAEEFIEALQRVRRRIVTGAPVPEADASDAPPPDPYAGHQTTGGWLMPAAGMAVPTGIDPEEAEAEAAARTKRRRVWAILGAIVLVLALALFGWLLFGRMETVPETIGLTEPAATQRLEERGFDVSTDRRFNPKVEAGKVYFQNPKSGQRKRHGSTVRIVVSKGREAVAVPNVANQTEAQARSTLKDAGFTNVDKQEQASSAVKSGIVIGTTPAASTQVPATAKITLTVSSGRSAAGGSNTQQVKVPDVGGKARDDAKKAIEAAGLTASFSSQETSDVRAGRVVSTDPPASTPVDKGSAVDVVIAKKPASKGGGSGGSSRISVPDVTGQTQAEATDALRSRGLKVKVKQVTTASKNDDGRVLSQSPSKGDLKRGESVTVSVGNYTASGGSGTGGTNGSTTDPGRSAAAGRPARTA